jgi:hypothetical protein
MGISRYLILDFLKGGQIVVADKRKIVFVSYSDRDHDKVLLFKKAIKKYSDLATPLVIADKKEALKSLSSKVQGGIRSCHLFVPIMTRNSISTQWMNQEIGFAFGLRKKDIQPIVEKNVVDKLKGFIHKQLDLSFTFAGNQRKSTENVSFRACCDSLLQHLFGEQAGAAEKRPLQNGSYAPSEAVQRVLGDGTRFQVRGVMLDRLLADKDSMALMAFNGRFVSAKGDGQLVADISLLDLWETFKLTRADSHVVFQSHTGKFIGIRRVADCLTLVADFGSIADINKFVIENVDDNYCTLRSMGGELVTVNPDTLRLQLGGDTEGNGKFRAIDRRAFK